MFKPKIFSEDRIEVLQKFIKDHPLAMLSCIRADGKIEMNLIPMTLYHEGDKGVIRCHMAKSNPQVESLRNAGEVLLTFTGAHGYVTPESYPTKKQHGKAVPTWNFSMVQVRGKPTLIDESDWILKQIEDMTNEMEAGNSIPWKVSDAPSDYIQSQLKLIIGLEIPISQIEGKIKANQNHPEENRLGVEKQFRDSGNHEMADYVLNKGIK